MTIYEFASKRIGLKLNERNLIISGQYDEVPREELKALRAAYFDRLWLIKHRYIYEVIELLDRTAGTDFAAQFEMFLSKRSIDRAKFDQCLFFDPKKV